MAPKGMKRPAAASFGARLSKKPAVDPSVAMCKLVAEALADSPLAGSVRNMLMQAVPSLGVYADVPHEYQKTLVEMIGETLGGVGDALSARKAAAQAKVASLDADNAALDATAVTAEEALAAATAGVAEALADATASDEAVAAAKKALNAAEVAQKSVDQEFVRAGANKEALDSAQTKVLAMREAAGASGDVREVLAVARKNGCDESLVDTIPEVLKKEASARGTFDGMVLQQLVEFFAERVDSAAKSITDCDALKAQRADAVAALATALGTATDNMTSAKDALRMAMAAEEGAQAALGAAKAAVKSFTSEKSAAAQELDTATDAVESFEKGPLAAYSELKERATPPPEEPKAAEPSAAAAEAPAAEATEAGAAA